jgi:hypothetical protein
VELEIKNFTIPRNEKFKSRAQASKRICRDASVETKKPHEAAFV